MLKLLYYLLLIEPPVGHVGILTLYYMLLKLLCELKFVFQEQLSAVKTHFLYFILYTSHKLHDCLNQITLFLTHKLLVEPIDLLYPSNVIYISHYFKFNATTPYQSDIALML